MIVAPWTVPDSEQPQWFNRFRLRLQTAIGPNVPVRLPSYLSTALPDPTKTPEALIAVTDIGKPAYSDGVYWYPLTLGAHL